MSATLFIFIVICFILSFLVIKTGLFFVALEIGLIGAGLLTYLVILIFFDFIFNRDINKKFLLISFVSSLLCIGVGIGLGAVSLVQFDIKENDDYTKSQFNQPMSNDLVIVDQHYYYDSHTPVEYIASDNTDVKIVVEHSRYMEANVYKKTDEALVWVYERQELTMDLIRELIDNINNKKIVTYNNDIKIKVYTTEENIKILKDNEAEYYDLMNDYIKRIDELNEEIDRSHTELTEVEDRFNSLKNYLKNNGYRVTYDEYGNLEIISNSNFE